MACLLAASYRPFSAALSIVTFVRREREGKWPAAIFTESVLRPIQSTIRHVRLSVCLFVQSRKTHILVDWRLLVKEHIANIGRPPEIFSFS